MLSRYENFSAIITEIYRHLVKISSREMKKYGLHGSSARLLLILLNEKSVTAAKIAKESGRNKAEISRTISDLEEKGLLVKNESSKNYRVILKLTEKGKETAENIYSSAERAVLFTGGSLSEEERAILYKALGHISDNLQIISKSGIPETNQIGEKK